MDGGGVASRPFAQTADLLSTTDAMLSSRPRPPSSRRGGKSGESARGQTRIRHSSSLGREGDGGTLATSVGPVEGGKAAERAPIEYHEHPEEYF